MRGSSASDKRFSERAAEQLVVKGLVGPSLNSSWWKEELVRGSSAGDKRFCERAAEQLVGERFIRAISKQLVVKGLVRGP